MNAQESASLKYIDMVQQALGIPLSDGELGIVLARAGAGKTACLTHIALEHILRGGIILHVGIDELPDKIKLWYQELLKNLAALDSALNAAELLSQIEPSRFILAYLHHTFSPARLDQSLRNLKEQVKFDPSCVILDGLDFDRTQRATIEALRHFALENHVSIWMSARTHRHVKEMSDRGIPYPCNAMDDLFHAILLLDPTETSIRIKVLKHGSHYGPELPSTFLDPRTYMLQAG